MVYAPWHDHTNAKGYFYEHILIAEEMVGHPLNNGEVVHHIDGNKQNNNPSNLMIFVSYGDHAAFHKGREIYEKDGLWHAKKWIGKCWRCGNEFEKEYSWQHYCSRECSKFRETPDVQGLINDLYENNGNFTLVSKKYNVTCNALRKRLRKQGYPTHSRDYKHKQ